MLLSVSSAAVAFSMSFVALLLCSFFYVAILLVLDRSLVVTMHSRMLYSEGSSFTSNPSMHACGIGKAGGKLHVALPTLFGFAEKATGTMVQ